MRATYTLTTLLLTCLLLLTGCYKGDIDDLRNEQAKQAERLAALEAWQQTVNTNINALQGVVTALEAKDFVTGVVPKLEGGTEVGYTITFAKSSPVVIYHGTKGTDGITPIIGVAQDTDGIYYWTVQVGTDSAHWLLDKGGNKITAAGATGKDATAPRVRINTTTNEWEISTDSGTTWQSTGVKANGEKGTAGAKGNAILVDTANNDYVIFTLTDGTILQMSKYGLGISFTAPAFYITDSPVDVPFTLTGSATNVHAIYAPQGWTIEIDKTGSKIKVTPPSTSEFTELSCGEALFVVSDGDERSVIQTLDLSNVVANKFGGIFYLNGEAMGVVIRAKTGETVTTRGLVMHKLGSSEVYPWGPYDTATSAINEDDGTENMRTIQAIPNWEDDYKPFKWCADRGEGWYLPAFNELKTLHPTTDSYTVLNPLLTGMGGTILSDNAYWSSTEIRATFAKGIRAPYWTVESHKMFENYVRAVRAY